MCLFVCLFSPPAQELLISDASSCLSWPFRFPAGITWGTKVTQDHPDHPFAHQWLLRSGLGYQQVLGGSVWTAYAPRASCRALLVTLGLEKMILSVHSLRWVTAASRLPVPMQPAVVSGHPRSVLLQDGAEQWGHFLCRWLWLPAWGSFLSICKDKNVNVALLLLTLK